MSVSRTRDPDSGPVFLSIVVPSFNEESVIAATCGRLIEVLQGIPKTDFEIVFVDDGSQDHTLQILRDLQAADHRIRLVALSRNFGHQLAVTAGLEHTSGEVVVLIDADLQDPPEVIPEMLQKWRRGADVVYGARVERKGETAFKLWTAKSFYRSINRISDIAIPLDTGDFRLMDRAVVDVLLSMPERDRFIRGMVAWLGFKQEALPYARASRLAGETKYPLRKMIAFALDGIISFSVVPLRLATWMGFITAGLAVIGFIYALLMRLLTDIWVPGWTLLFIACLSIGGMQLVFLGVLGEYTGRIYAEVKRRPLYVVRERIGFNISSNALRDIKLRAYS
jgi:dolichol-phosphate mannosyltransferase